MKKLFKRFIAYSIDMMVIMLITQSLAGIPMINKQLNTYNKYYDEYVETLDVYGNFKTDLMKDYEDEELSQEEYQSLVEDNDLYLEDLAIYYEDGKLSEEEYSELNKKINSDYGDEYKRIYYKMEQNSVAYFAIYFVTTLVYFIGFNKFTGGQTLGKKLTRLKIVSSNERRQVPIWSYLVRTIIVYHPIYYLVKLIGTGTLNMDDYYSVTSIFSNIQYYLEILIILTVMIRFDGRGIHDLLARTRVIMIDRDGNEVNGNLETILESKKNDNKKRKKPKKIIDEEPSE